MNDPNNVSLKIFVVDDEEAVRKDMVFDLEKLGLEVKAFDTCEACLSALSWNDVGVIFTDYRIQPVGSRMQGNVLLDRLVAWRSPLVAVMVSGRNDTEKLLVEEAFRLGVNSRGHCVSYLNKPIFSDELIHHAEEALAYARRWAKRKQRERQMIQLLLERITAVEWFVMEGVLAGKTSRQIAEEKLKLQKDKDRFNADRLFAAEYNVAQQRDQINRRKDRLASLSVRIEDYDVLLDDRFGGVRTKGKRASPHDQFDGLRTESYGVLSGDRFGALLDLATAELAMRRGLLTIEQADALRAAEESGIQTEASPLLNAALERVLARDLRTWMHWTDKLVDIGENRSVSKPPPPRKPPAPSNSSSIRNLDVWRSADDEEPSPDLPDSPEPL